MGAVAGREPAAARVAGWLERAFNPIMVKELRASMRGSRFFIAHLTLLTLFACGLLLIFAAVTSSQGGSGPRDPSVVGSKVFLITQLIHLGVVLIVIPGLAATSITGEREMLTHDLLLSTTLTARQIVWGKFTASMTQTFTLFVSMIPLVGLCFLYGGVTMYQIVANYVFLFALSALMIIFALGVSASARSTPRAVASIYGLTTFLVVIAGVLLVSSTDSAFVQEMALAYGFLSPGETTHGGVSAFERIMYIHLVPGFSWAALFALFFINAVNRLKPLYANRSTNLRIYFAAVVAGACFLTITGLYMEVPPSTYVYDRATCLMSYCMTLLSAALMAALFACEEPILPPGLAAEVASLRGPRRLLRLLYPGSGSGAAFAFASIGILTVLSFAALVPYTEGFARGAWSGFPEIYPLGSALSTVLVWTFFCVTLARMLAVVLVGRPLLIRSILVTAAIFLSVFPLVHWAVAHSIERNELDPDPRHGPLTLALSPAAAILSALELAARRRDFPLLAGSMPIPALFTMLYLAAGTALLIIGERAFGRLRRLHLKRGR